MFVSLHYNKQKYDTAKKNGSLGKANAELLKESPGNSPNPTSDHAKLYTTTLKLKNTDILRLNGGSSTEKVSTLKPESNTTANRVHDTPFNVTTPLQKFVSLAYNKEKYLAAIKPKTSPNLTDPSSDIHIESGFMEKQGESLENVSPIKSDLSSLVRGAPELTNPESNRNSGKLSPPISPHSFANLLFRPEYRPIDPNSPSKIVKLQYNEAQRVKMFEKLPGVNFTPVTPTKRSHQEKEKLKPTLATSNRTSSGEAIVGLDPLELSLKNKTPQRRKSSSRARPVSVSSTISSSGLYHQSSSPVSKSSTPASLSSSSSSSSSPSRLQSPSPSPASVLESEPNAQETADLPVDESLSDESNQALLHQPQRSKIHTCEEALETMSRYADLQTEISSSTAESNGLASYQQVEIDWFKSLIVVAEKLNDLKDTYRAIQLIKRKKTAS